MGNIYFDMIENTFEEIFQIRYCSLNNTLLTSLKDSIVKVVKNQVYRVKVILLNFL